MNLRQNETCVWLGCVKLWSKIFVEVTAAGGCAAETVENMQMMKRPWSGTDEILENEQVPDINIFRRIEARRW